MGLEDSRAIPLAGCEVDLIRKDNCAVLICKACGGGFCPDLYVDVITFKECFHKRIENARGWAEKTLSS